MTRGRNSTGKEGKPTVSAQLRGSRAGSLVLGTLQELSGTHLGNLHQEP